MKKTAIYSVITIVLALISIKPFNYFCKLSAKCQPLVPSYYLPTFAGKEKINIEFQAINHFADIDFQVLKKNISTPTGKNITAKFIITNNTDKDIKIQPMFFIDPSFVGEYLKRFECLCTRQYLIKKNSSINLSAKFRIKKTIEKDKNFQPNQNIIMGYEIVDILIVED